MVEYNIALNDISTIYNSVNAQYVILGGDFNTDLNRTSHCTNALTDYVNTNDMYFCVNDTCSTVEFTYYSKSSDARSLIDHFIVGLNCKHFLIKYDEMDGPDNFSDHSAIRCVIEPKGCSVS